MQGSDLAIAGSVRHAVLFSRCPASRAEAVRLYTVQAHAALPHLLQAVEGSSRHVAVTELLIRPTE
ncbi:MAG TPA: hypothetical protein VGS80_23675 [Ktedonobacterales bacterium]|nr:hypothetical protein [Ktedonobacterales bacterium]